jgi:hypothetical protein
MLAKQAKKTTLLLAAAILLGGLWLAGCDERVTIVHKQDVPVLKHQTWAWRPAPAKQAAAAAAAKDERPVISRDVIGGRQPAAAPAQAAPVPETATDAVRQELRTAIERQLTEKGLTQTTDPATADFLVNYHYAMRRHTATVERVYPGAYPGLVCGPFGCWQGAGYGPPEVGFENIRFREGTFVFDFYKRSPNQMAYRSVGFEPPNRVALSHDEVNDMVHALLKGLKTSGK